MTQVERLESLCDTIAMERDNMRLTTLCEVADALAPQLVGIDVVIQNPSMMEEILLSRLQAIKSKLIEMGVQL